MAFRVALAGTDAAALPAWVIVAANTPDGITTQLPQPTRKKS